jgi:prepilin-type processing-associated H-X9-DG protein
MNQVKQMILAMHNHVDSYKEFPSGGIYPWPNIEDYVTSGGAAYGPGDQGLSWAYQILPFLEEGSVHGLRNTGQIERTAIAGYFCPSRRSPTRDTVNLSAAYLMDYAAAVPARSRGQLAKITTASYDTAYLAPSGPDTAGCNREEFWGYRGGPIHRDAFQAKKTGFYSPITFAKISDGSSSTLVVGEKFLIPSRYLIGDWHDDKGWADGWDPDTLRCTICRIMPDRELIANEGTRLPGFRFGSAHSSGMNAGFADASVQFLNYDIDQETFNRMGNRMDDELVNREAL